jgi:hypothetical protein
MVINEVHAGPLMHWPVQLESVLAFKLASGG